MLYACNLFMKYLFPSHSGGNSSSEMLSDLPKVKEKVSWKRQFKPSGALRGKVGGSQVILKTHSMGLGRGAVSSKPVTQKWLLDKGCFSRRSLFSGSPHWVTGRSRNASMWPEAPRICPTSFSLLLHKSTWSIKFKHRVKFWEETVRSLQTGVADWWSITGCSFVHGLSWLSKVLHHHRKCVPAELISTHPTPQVGSTDEEAAFNWASLLWYLWRSGGRRSLYFWSISKFQTETYMLFVYINKDEMVLFVLRTWGNMSNSKQQKNSHAPPKSCKGWLEQMSYLSWRQPSKICLTVPGEFSGLVLPSVAKIIK